MRTVMIAAMLAMLAGNVHGETNIIDMGSIQFARLGVGCSTNTYMSSSNSQPDTIEYMQEHGTLTNVIKRLAKDGHICAVFGHQWRGGRQGEGEMYPGGPSVTFCDYHPNTTYRTCRICGKCESQTINNWE